MFGAMITRWEQRASSFVRQVLLSVGLLALRLGLGAFMLVHGWQKLAAFGEMSGKFPDPLGIGSATSLILAIFAELVCSIAIILGLFTRLSCVPLIVTMAVAAFIVHADDPWKMKELAIIYLLGYAVLAFTGPGPFSLDLFIWNRKPVEK